MMQIGSIQLRLVALSSLLVALLAVLLPAPVSAQTQPGCFPSDPTITNCISSRFLSFWNANGGLATFGYPITALVQEANQERGQVYDTQWFERVRLEYHPDQPAPYDVQLGRIGADLLAAKNIDWQTYSKAQASDAHYFAETGHAVSNAAFWSYWSTHGLSNPGQNAFQQSLTLFGYPISEATMEQDSQGEMVLTQWFERARFEYHPQSGVLLGLLGSELHTLIAQSGAVQLTDADNGKTIALQLNQTLVVTLPSNRSTGYSWKIVGVSKGILRQQGEVVYRPVGSLPGSPGTETFRFTVVGTGNTTLMMEYQPAARGAPPQPDYVFSVAVTVQ